MRSSIEIGLAAVKAQLRVAVTIGVAQFATEVLRHIFTDQGAGSESRTESSARRTGRVANRRVVIKTEAARGANLPGLRKTTSAAGQGHEHKVSPQVMSHPLRFYSPTWSPSLDRRP